MGHFIYVESVLPDNPNYRARILLNIDAVVQFVEIDERLTVAVTQKAELESVEFICGRAKRPLSICLRHSLAEVQQMITSSYNR